MFYVCVCAYMLFLWLIGNYAIYVEEFEAIIKTIIW